MTPAPISVERLRELLAKATPGPWIIDTNETYSIRDKDGGRFVLMTHLLGRNGEGGRRSPNEVAATLRLIVAMHEALPALLHQLAERDAEVERLQEYVREADRRVGEQFMAAQRAETNALRLLNKCGEAFDRERARDEATGLLRECDTVAKLRGEYGVADCIDNDGQPYQSAHLDAFLAASGGA